MKADPQSTLLHAALFRAATARENAAAVVWPSGVLTHGQLRDSTRRIAGRLAKLGIGRGDRVAVCLPKCAEAVQAILGVLSSGAAYVPLDASLPPARILALVRDGQMSLLITTPAIGARLAELASPAELPATVPVAGTATGGGLEPWVANARAADPVGVAADDIATLLYTSGSSGEPKAVMLSHGNVSSFVQWAIHRFELQSSDRFSSHSPLHFDLSMLDVFGSLELGASVFLIDEKTALFPAAVVRAIAEHQCTVWYSVPTALHWMLERGGIGERPLPSLRFVFFAGEVFPIPSLRKLMRALPCPQYVHWYGPTETNVCTYYVLPGPPDEAQMEIPIGVACEHLEVRVCSEDPHATLNGPAGEICVAGPAVMQGYWRKPEETRAARFGGREDSYRTGDLGGVDEDGLIYFRGRRDHQVKIRGHRVELLAVEVILCRHPQVAQAAVVLVSLHELDGKIVAFVVPATGEEPTSTSLRRHCAAELPAYAVPSAFVIVERMPSTSRGKVDRVQLVDVAERTLAARGADGAEGMRR